MRVFRPARKGPRGGGVSYQRWYIELRTPEIRRLAGYADRKATEQLGRELERVVLRLCRGESPSGDLARSIENLPPPVRKRLGAWGLIDPRGLAAARSLEELLAEWGASMRTRSSTAEHVRRSVRRVEALFGACGFRRWSDIQAGPIEQHLAGLRDGHPGSVALHLKNLRGLPKFTRRREQRRLTRQGLGARASNHYLAAARQMTRWAVLRGYAAEDPLRVLRPLNPRVDRRHVRRAITEGQLVALLAAAYRGPDLGGVSGPRRALVYALAAETGLRASELASLRVCSFELEGDRPALTLAAASSKHRREDRISLRLSTARALQGLLAGRGALESAFGLSPAWRPPRALRADLEAAGLPYVDESGRRFDFHALRGLMATRLIAHGASPRATQELMRHSTADLTMSVYARLRPDEERRALDLLPDVLPAALLDPALAEAATGTECGAAHLEPLEHGSVRLSGPGSPPEGVRMVEDRGVEPLTSGPQATPEIGLVDTEKADSGPRPELSYKERGAQCGVFDPQDHLLARGWDVSTRSHRLAVLALLGLPDELVDLPSERLFGTLPARARPVDNSGLGCGEIVDNSSRDRESGAKWGRSVTPKHEEQDAFPEGASGEVGP